MVEHRSTPFDVMQYARAERLAITARHHGELKGIVLDLLFKAGIPTDPAFNDSDIIAALRKRLGLKPDEPWNEYRADYHFKFKEELARTLQEAEIEVKEPVTEIPNLVFSLRITLLPATDPSGSASKSNL